MGISGESQGNERNLREPMRMMLNIVDYSGIWRDMLESIGNKTNMLESCEDCGRKGGF